MVRDKAEDYSRLGLKCGIEIHQQLKGKKLFCNCPAEIIDKGPDMQVCRELRAVIGETGEIDKAALHEQMRNKRYVYNYYDESCCLVDLDEEPPRPINKEAIKAAFIMAKLLGTDIIDEIQVMRKTVVDGSNTTGFQRTALVAVDGCIETSSGKVRIESLCLEEDAAKIVRRDDDKDIYNLSRLGIPLIEIATAPDMKTPGSVKEAAEKIGMMLRSTGFCKRGLGTIRQDVNVSISKGNRVEIKGAQDLKTISKVVEYEAQRQMNIIALQDKVKSSKIDEKYHDITSLFERSDSKVIKAALKKKGVVYAIKMPGFYGLIGAEIQPGKRLGTELSDYAKVKAGVGGLFHSDELPRYGITKEDIRSVKKMLSCKKEDAFIMIADSAEKAKNAFDAVIERISKILKGVPKEVRKANPDATSTYLRPMPTGARMYPETDVMPFKAVFLDVRLPEMIDEKAKRYEKVYGLSKDLAMDMAKSEYDDVFEKYASKKGLKPGFIAEILVSFKTELVRNYIDADPDIVTEDDLGEIFDALADKKIPKESVLEAIVNVASGKKFDVGKYKALSAEELEKGIKKIIKENKDAPFGAVMGEVMKQYRGRADGKVISELVKRHLGSG